MNSEHDEPHLARRSGHPQDHHEPKWAADRRRRRQPSLKANSKQTPQPQGTPSNDDSNTLSPAECQ